MKYIFKNTIIKNIQSFGQIWDMSYMFSGIKLTSLDLSKIDTTQILNMEGLCKDSESLRSLNLSKFDT